MNKKSYERGYMLAKKIYEKEGSLESLNKDEFSKDFRKGIEQYEKELENKRKGG